ncbi:leucine-rich repeat-containing protein 57-like [Arctopsyche grandis]|uniref:leucine-rich repeat-containing protein 57-like n=1 Tax=Arctopsyche grandis TaxID=121162 RepID=UPI00406D9319
MGNSGLKQHYETAGKTGLLKISNQKLKELPPEVKDLNGLIRNLDVSENRFHSLPECLGEFSILKQLNVSQNRLEGLPQTVGKLTKLECLNAGFNMIKHVPPSTENLSNLKQIYLNNNMLTDFPLELCKLKHLDMLELSHNKITNIPPQIRQLQASELNMNQNQVSNISEEISQCSKLKVLRLEENCLPLTAIHASLLRDSKIHTLCLDGNLFDSKQLMSLDGYNEYMERFTAVKKKMF